MVSLYLHVCVSGFNVEELVSDLFYWIEKGTKGEVIPGNISTAPSATFAINR